MARMQRGMTVPEEARTELLKIAEQIEQGETRGCRFLADMYAGGWSCGSLGRAMGWPRNRVHYWATWLPAGSKPYAHMPEVPEVPERPETPPRPILAPARARQLKELHELAVQLRGGHDKNHPFRKASEKLTQLLHEEHQRGVTYREMSEALDVKPMTIRERLKRHNYLTPYPTLTPYKGKQKKES